MGRSLALFLVSLLAALSLAVWLLRPTIEPNREGSGEERIVRIYQVPVDRAESIAAALRVVLLTAHERSAPIGNASLPAAGQLLVSAPARMQASIAEAVREMSGGTQSAANSAADAPVMMDVWVVAVGPAEATDDPALAGAADALEAARSSMALGSFSLMRRAAVAAASDGRRVQFGDDQLNGELTFAAGEGETIHAQLRIELDRRRGSSSFDSRLPLQSGRWQVLALLSGNASGAVERPQTLVLIRATRLTGSESSPPAL
jgi:hypothetical protein